MCGHHKLLPTVLKAPIPFKQTGAALCWGGYAEVRKGVQCDRKISVKAMRIYSNGNLQKMFRKEVAARKALRHSNILPLIGVMRSETKFAMSPDWMANGRVNEFFGTKPDVNLLEPVGLLSKVLLSRLQAYHWLDLVA